MRFLSVAFLLLTVPAWAQHGQTGPQPTGEGAAGGPGQGSVSAKAIAQYDFDDPSNLGKDSKGKYNLTPQNTPTATGGATGTAAHFNEAGSQYAQNDAPSWGGTLTGKDFMWCGWNIQGEDDDNAGIAGQYISNIHWLVYRLSGNGNLIGVVYDDDSDSAVASVASGTAGPLITKRNLTCLYWDVSEKKATLNINNGGATAASAANADVDDFTDTPSPFAINKFSTGNYSDDLTINANAFWADTELDFSTLIAAFYNSGKGGVCDSYSVATKEDMKACWNMKENPATQVVYNDSVNGASTIRKIGGTNQWTESYDRSVSTYAGDISITFTGSSDNNYTMTCLSTDPDATSYTEADFCLYKYMNTWYMFTDGTNESGSLGTGSQGASLEIRKTDTEVTLWKNGVLGYTSATPATASSYYVFHTVYQPDGAPTTDIQANGSDVSWAHLSDDYLAYGSNPLTPVNTPTQSNALVEQPASGMSVHVVSASSQNLEIAQTPTPASKPVSVCAWWYPADYTAGAQYIVTAYPSTGTGGWYIYQNGSSMNFAGRQNGEAAVIDSKAISGNQWYHVCGIWDASRVEVYVDGVSSGSPGTSTGLWTTNDVKLSVGAYTPNASYDDGALDQVLIFDYALSADEVKQLMAETAGN